VHVEHQINLFILILVNLYYHCVLLLALSTAGFLHWIVCFSESTSRYPGWWTCCRLSTDSGQGQTIRTSTTYQTTPRSSRISNKRTELPKSKSPNL